jgi:hypothetical protein
VSLFLVLDQVDLADHRCVTTDERTDWAGERSFSYHETSARTGDGITELFTVVSAVLVDQLRAEKSEKEVPDQPTKEERNKRCC